MTPGARVQAAVDCLDAIFAGEAAERVLTRWARGSRFAGSSDRAAIRTHVFDALRRVRSAAWAGGLGNVALEAMNGRAVMAGLLAGQGRDLRTLFNGQGHAPAPLDPLPDPGPAPDGVRLDMPDWLLPQFHAALGEVAEPVMQALRDRARVILRANLSRIDRGTLIARLAEDGVAAEAHPASPSAIRLDGAPRGLANKPAFLDGAFELQDAGSQALVDRLPLQAGERVLDLCAGGGGKTLAMADRGAGPLFAHDVDPDRMADLPARAARAGLSIAISPQPEDDGPFDGVVVDAPCSGSGSWRRAPEAKWRLTEARLSELVPLQGEILARATRLTRPGGWVGYMTCSLLDAENGAQVDAAVASHRLEEALRWSCTPLNGCDGFFLSVLRVR